MGNCDCRIRMIALVYSSIWVLSAVIFWLFCRTSQMAMLHIIVVQLLILPIVTFILSVLMGKSLFPRKFICITPICFAGMYVLFKLITQSLLQFTLAEVAVYPTFYDFFALAFISIIGLSIGWVWRRIHKILNDR